MQFTLRDVFWATVVVGLIIGIVIEHNDVLALKGWKEEAAWWDAASHALADRLEQKGEQVVLEKQKLLVTDAAGRMVLKQGKSNWSAPWSNSWLTGHAELDWYISLGVPYLILCGALGWWARRYRAKHPVVVPTFEPRRNYVMGSINVFGLFFFLACSINAYWSRHPFSGTVNFCFLALQIFALRYFGFRKITPEYAKTFNASWQKPFTLREAFRW